VLEETIRERVARGAALMDSKGPKNWRETCRVIAMVPACLIWISWRPVTKRKSTTAFVRISATRSTADFFRKRGWNN
jgi:hypothetical protein